MPHGELPPDTLRAVIESFVLREGTDYGSREFTVKDPEGHSWSVGTYNPWAAQG